MRQRLLIRNEFMSEPNPNGLKIAESPEQDRPRERLLHIGAKHLRLADLIAVLIRSGRPGESAVQAGEKIAAKFSTCLEQLPEAGAGELKEISPAVAKTAFCQIMAGIELGRRVAEAKNSKDRRRKIGGTQDAKHFCERQFARLVSDSSREEFHIVSLDTKNHVVNTHQISVGTLNASLVHPREVFRPAIKDAASSVILVHNHPSGDPTPSQEDLAVTRRLEASGETLGIDVLDHIVLGAFGSVSIRETK
jgi:DNA repair protein RadC